MPAGVINYQADLRVLVSVRGHPFERDAFGDMFEAMNGVAATFVDQPAAAQLMAPEFLSAFDVLCLYDMPGLDFLHPDKPGFVPPSEELKDGFARLLDTGKGVVALHHAIAGWPEWPDYADWIGGRFLYRPSRVRGVERPDSGYCHNVEYTALVEPDMPSVFSPIVRNLPASFPVKDELYLAEIFENEVHPLIRSDFTFVEDNFYSAELAVKGQMLSREGWSHPPSSNIVAWAKRARRSPIVYVQFGDGPETYENEHYQVLLHNALRWSASKAALAWARSA